MQRKLKVGLALGIVFVLLGSCAYLLNRSNCWAELKDVLGVVLSSPSPLPLRQTQFEQVIKDYSDGMLKSSGGVIILPSTLSSVTTDGRVYVTQHKRFGTAFLFVTWQGKGSNFLGYLHCAKLNTNFSNGSDETSITVVIPEPARNCVAPVEVSARRLNIGAWYEVTHGGW